MAEVGDRRPRGGYRRWVHPFRDQPALAVPFDRATLSLSDQIDRLQASRGCSVHQVAKGAHLSKQGVINLRKTQSDPKFSTLVRLAAFFGGRILIVVDPA